MSREVTLAQQFEALPARRYIPDAGYLVTAVAAVSLAGVGTASSLPTGIALANAAMMTAVAAIAFTLMDRIELALWGLVPLLVVVRAEPAPVDFMVIALFGALVTRGEILRPPPHPLALLTAVLIVTSNLLALLFALDTGRAIAHAATTVHLMVLGYVTYLLAARGHEHGERAYIAAGLALVLLTVATLLGAPFTDVLRYDDERVQGLFKDPNVFGPFVLPAATLLMLGLGTRRVLARALLIIALAIPVAASQSRGALLAFGIATATVGVVALVRRWTSSLAIAVGFGALAVAGLIAFAVVSADTSSHTLLEEQIYDANRFAVRDTALGYLADHPLTLGVGAGNARAVLGTVNDIHDTYVRILVETGPLGLLGLALLAGFALSPLRADRPGAAAWAAAIVGFLSVGLFIDVYHWRHLWVATGIGVAAATASLSTERTP